MKRRSRAGGEAIKGRRRKAEKRHNAPKAVARFNSSAIAEETEVARLTRDLRDALEQQVATSEVLQVINGSAGDLQPVFAAMLENAVRICDATFGVIYRWDGAFLHALASHKTPPALAEARRRSPIRPRPDMVRTVTTKSVVHIPDLAAHAAYTKDRDPALVSAVELGGVRTFLVVPMFKGTEFMGSFSLYRQEVRPFTDKQIALVTNFAAQAVIAIENARLVNELRQRTTDLTEALEQQTATSDVLKVISGSPGELKPVFDAMLESATRICDATFGAMLLRDGDGYRCHSDRRSHRAVRFSALEAGAILRIRFAVLRLPDHTPHPLPLHDSHCPIPGRQISSNIRASVPEKEYLASTLPAGHFQTVWQKP